MIESGLALPSISRRCTVIPVDPVAESINKSLRSVTPHADTGRYIHARRLVLWFEIGSHCSNPAAGHRSLAAQCTLAFLACMCIPEARSVISSGDR